MNNPTPYYGTKEQIEREIEECYDAVSPPYDDCIEYWEWLEHMEYLERQERLQAEEAAERVAWERDLEEYDGDA
jgi:hypothetical protein